MSESEEIQKLLNDSPYSNSIKDRLEKYAESQCLGKAPYMFDANRTLLKLYQFYPPADNERTALVLLNGFLQFPSTDLLALSCLVPVSNANPNSRSPLCASILESAELLDSCQFSEFWTVWNNLVSEQKQQSSMKVYFTDEKVNSQRQLQIRNGILDVLALTYRVAPMAVVLSSLDLKTAEELTLLNHPAVEKIDCENNVNFHASQDNTKRNRVYQDVDFSAISGLMTQIA